MKDGIQAIIISCGDPQFERCLKSVQNQSVPFARIDVIKDVIPEAKAQMVSYDFLEYQWAFYIGGDFILYKDANEIALEYIKKNPGNHEYNFGLWDKFMRRQICCCTVFESEMHKNARYNDELFNDVRACEDMASRYRYKRVVPSKQGIIVGTHFDKPDAFQVFRRFYSRGVKFSTHPKGPYRFLVRQLNILMRNTNKKHLYRLAIAAYNYGFRKRYYPSSHNITLDKELYEKFKREHPEWK